MSSLRAHLLIATEALADPFNHSVVLLVRHNADGALGLILNRPTSATLKDAWSKVSQGPCRRDESIFLGGPCEGPLVALHTREFLLEWEVMPGLYFSAGKDKLEQLAAESGGAPVRFFAGYSGWAAGQLEDEIARGAWSIMPAKCEHAFAHEDDLWQRATRHVADAAWRSSLGIKHMPKDLRAN
ncbi:MAG TPA: YqgE/AlgH family protein [Pirellulales bacterium]|nr:YqgE/AlgH family protein [Pirellulales bacterium]